MKTGTILVLTFVLSGFLMSCASIDRKTGSTTSAETANPAATAAFPLLDTTDYKGVIIPPDVAARNRFLAGRYTKFWTPSPKQIKKAAACITAYVKTSNDKEIAQKAPQLKWYRRQYIGYTWNGEKRIFCNFIPGVDKEGDFLPEWRQRFVHWWDDPNFWGIYYNVAKNVCIDRYNNE